ncbi:lipopolysaccharide biosynthesis protein [Arsenicicoccus dermatophilus]|uniref:lipopolysaccharide biosynthesis protein n=1 Tax=Arsenicicoccus dermatophilus TaxID=1076331 RepID=UPI001F4D07EF|nr:oligosaccharide flippase family protein [Arsenicicoccus dermatophilus]
MSADPEAYASPEGYPDPAAAAHQPPPPSSAAKTLLRGASWQTVAQVAPLALNLLLTPVVLGYFGLEAYGKFLLVNSLVGAMATFDGGIGASAQRYFTLYAGKDERDRITSLLVSLLGIITVVSVVVFAGLWNAAHPILAFFKTSDRLMPETAYLFRTMVVVVGVALVRQLFACVLFAMQKFSVPSITGLVGHAIYATGLLLTIHLDLGLYGVAYTFMVQQVMSTLLIVPSAMRFLTFRRFRFLTGAETREFFGYAWKAQIASVLEMAGLQGDMLIVQRFASPYAAIFGTGSQFAMQLRMLPTNAGTPIQATLGRWVGENGAEDTLPKFEKIQRLWVTVVSGWVAVGVPACLFGVVEWLRMPSPLPGQVAALALAGHFFPLLALPTILWVLTLGHPEIDMRYGFVNVTLNLALTAAVIVPFGVLGSVAATVTAQFVSLLYLLHQVRRHLPLPPRPPLIHVPVLEMIFAASISYLGVYGVSRIIEMGYLPKGGLGLVVCGLGAVPAVLAYVWATVGFRSAITMVKQRRGGDDLAAA